MANNQKLRLIDACSKIGSGATPRGGKEAYKGGDTALIRSQNIYNDGFHRDGLVYIDDDQSAELKNVEVQLNDVLLNITGDSVARCCQVAEDVLPARVNQHVAIIRPKRNIINAKFLRYVLISNDYQARLLSLSSAGATRPALTKAMIEDLEILAPELPEQNAIAYVLSSLDDKIELNRQMNETLEGLARTLFRSWFVDFDPVHAKGEGRQPEGMNAETAALFPSEFVESEIGMIPKGWQVTSLSEAFEINPTRKLTKGESAPYLDMGNMPTKSARALEVYDREFGSGMKFKNGDTLVARITPCLENGKTAYVDFLEENQVAWGSTEYIVMRPKDPLPTEFAYFLARTEEFRTFAVSNMTGSSGRQRVPADCFNNYKIVVPDGATAQAFGKVAKLFMKQMKANDDQSATLVQQRESLLPKLISGEIRLPEKMIAEFGSGVEST